MTFGKRLLVSSTSLAALIVAAPALAATDTDTATSTSEVVVTGIKESLQRAIQIKRVNTDQVDAISGRSLIQTGVKISQPNQLPIGCDRHRDERIKWIPAHRSNIADYPTKRFPANGGCRGVRQKMDAFNNAIRL